MAQYSLGTVTVTNGSPVVTGASTAWASNVQAGDLFAVRGTGVTFTVASVQSNGQLTLSAPWGGASGASLPYVTSRSFTPEFRIPFPEPRDIEAVSILKAAIAAIESLLRTALAPTLVLATSNRVLTASDRGSVIKCKTGVTAITLPDIASVPVGWRVRLTSGGVGFTVNRGSATIDGAASNLSISANATRWLQKQSESNWESYV